VRAAAFRPDGRAVATGSDDRTARLWAVAPAVEGRAELILAWVEALTDLRRSPEGSLAPLDGDEWTKALARQGGAPMPAEDRLGWHREQAHAAEVEGRWAAAVWHLERLEKAGQVRPQLYYRLAMARAALGQWQDAARDMEKAVPPSGGDPLPRAHFAILTLHNGDGKKYSALCNSLITGLAEARTRVGGPIGGTEPGRRSPPDVAGLAAWACALSAEPPADLTPLVGLLREAPDGDPGKYLCARALGAILYRQGQTEEAVKQLEAAGKLRPQPSPSVWLLLALAHQRAGRPEQGKEWLSKAEGWIAAAHKAAPDGKVPWDRLPWYERVALELLQREAVSRVRPGKEKP
jgi:Flp pilus assembly protein TadD